MAAAKDKPKTPEDPRKKAMQRDQLARNAATGVLSGGRSSTMLTGQKGVAGQAMTDRPTLLGG